jgi:hypothetical protein
LTPALTPLSASFDPSVGMAMCLNMYTPYARPAAPI